MPATLAHPGAVSQDALFGGSRRCFRHLTLQARPEVDQQYAVKRRRNQEPGAGAPGSQTAQNQYRTDPYTDLG